MPGLKRGGGPRWEGWTAREWTRGTPLGGCNYTLHVMYFRLGSMYSHIFRRWLDHVRCPWHPPQPPSEDVGQEPYKDFKAPGFTVQSMSEVLWFYMLHLVTQCHFQQLRNRSVAGPRVPPRGGRTSPGHAMFAARLLGLLGLLAHILRWFSRSPWHLPQLRMEARSPRDQKGYGKGCSLPVGP